MKFNRSIQALLLAGSLLGGTYLIAQDQNTTGTSAPADNTKMNQRDRDASQPTADQQKDNRPIAISPSRFGAPSKRTNHFQPTPTT